MSSATPDAERTPPLPPTGSSAGGSRQRRWRRGQEAPRPGELAVSAETAEIDVLSEELETDRAVVDERWSEPTPGAEQLAELMAKREVAEAAAAAATERVIAQAVATGMSDPDELPDVRRGLLRRRTGYPSPAPARAVVDPAVAAAASERAQQLKLPRKVRRELERATKEMTEAALGAHDARKAAERAAEQHARQTARAEAAATEAVRGREVAERAALESAALARAEAQRRAVAEQLASETVEQVTAARAERVRVEQEAAQQAAAAEAAYAARAEAEEAALKATLEREAAETRARELATSLEEARAALLEQTTAAIAAGQAPRAAPTQPAAEVATQVEAKPAPRSAPEPKLQPEGVPELVEFRSPSSSAVVTVLLGIGALVAAGIAVYEAYLDRLTTQPGIVASVVTLVLVVVVGRSRGSAGQVWLEHGVLHVDEGDSRRRFDLTNANTKVEMVGQPGDRRWKVLFLRKGMAPYEINARLVDPEPFVEALLAWRPTLRV